MSTPAAAPTAPWPGGAHPVSLPTVDALSFDGLPFAPFPVPPYRPCAARTWRFGALILAACPGYFRGPQPMPFQSFALARDAITWMSLTPMEVESQAAFRDIAQGHVVVCGLGMGLMAYGVGMKPEVTRVTVVERDPEVVAMFHEFSGFADWACRDKVEIITADARETNLGAVDFLYADIWPFYRMDVMVPDMRAIAGTIQAPRCGYWGQELDMVDHHVAQGGRVETFDAAAVEAFRAHTGLPLVGLEEIPDYPALCRAAAVNPAIRAQRVGA